MAKLIKYRFLKDPSRGVFLEVALTLDDDHYLALKMMKEIAEELYSRGATPTVPRCVAKNGVCFSYEETESAFLSPFAIMQDGRSFDMEAGTKLEDVVEKEWPESEIKRAVMGLDAPAGQNAP